METSYYSIGWDCNPILMCTNEQIEYFSKVDDYYGIQIWYDIQSEERSVRIYMNTVDVGWSEVTPNIQDMCILDISLSGERWEGEVLNNQPFGYGLIYNENNIITYMGFMINGKKECFGITYYPEKSDLC